MNNNKKRMEILTKYVSNKTEKRMKKNSKERNSISLCFQNNEYMNNKTEEEEEQIRRRRLKISIHEQDKAVVTTTYSINR